MMTESNNFTIFVISASEAFGRGPLNRLLCFWQTVHGRYYKQAKRLGQNIIRAEVITVVYKFGAFHEFSAKYMLYAKWFGNVYIYRVAVYFFHKV